MTEKIKNNESKYSDSEQEQRLPEEVTAAVKPLDDEEDNIATPEDMEEFIRSRRERREAGKKKSYIDSDDEEPPMDYEANESAMDPYLEPDPTLPKVEYKESIYLSRGCNHCPESYTPVSETELRSCCKVGSCNWMKGIRQPMEKPFDCVEVRFKNNRKEFYRLPDGIDVSDGDIVAVEGIPGHDVGIVSLTGEVCRIQMLKKKVDPESDTIKKLFRRAKVSDIERWTSAIREEENTLKKTRQIAEDLGLVMGEVFSQALGDKAGIRRYGSFLLPMDETLVLIALDLSGRPYLVYDLVPPVEKVGSLDTALFHEFFQAFCVKGGINLHVKLMAGGEIHHIFEAVFKGLARALEQAVSHDPKEKGIPSTKGIL